MTMSNEPQDFRLESYFFVFLNVACHWNGIIPIGILSIDPTLCTKNLKKNLQYCRNFWCKATSSSAFSRLLNIGLCQS